MLLFIRGDFMKKNRGLTTRTAISNAVETKLLEQLKQYSEETGIPMSKLLDKSIDLFLKTVNK